MAAEALRRRVGNANAASTARPGKPNISARSDPAIIKLAATATRAPTKGTEICRCDRWRRQRHKVHIANGQAGHMNHNHWRAMPGRSATPIRSARQRHAPSAAATTALATVEISNAGTSPRAAARRDWPHTSSPPRPSATATAGAPLPASSGRDRQAASLARPTRQGAAARAYKNSVAAHNCASSGVVSWPSSSRPSVAISANTAPSATARA